MDREGPWICRTIALSAAIAALGCGGRVEIQPEGNGAHQSGGSSINGGSGGSSKPTEPLGDLRVLSAGGEHTCGLRTDGTIVCWGDNSYNQLNAPGGTFEEIGPGGLHSCARRADGTIACWGHMSNEPATSPQGSFAELGCGNIVNCARRDDGNLLCWWTLNKTLLVDPTGPSKPVKSISLGGMHGCGLHADQTAECWSVSGFGLSASAPALAAPKGPLKVIDAGGNSNGTWSCAILPDDSVKCWGEGPVPKSQVPSGGFASISAGPGSHACGVRFDGSVACWGDNTYGQASPPPGKFVSVTTGGTHSCGILTDGSVTCWGDNEYGQLVLPPAQ